MYYPQSQIKTNLYTSGNEFALKSSPSIPYKGFYYKVSTGKLFTGKSPQDSGNLPLIPLKGKDLNLSSLTTPSVKSPITTTSIQPNLAIPPPPERFLPLYNALIPTEEDYKIGEFQRYFCKKTNELLYLEIDKDTFQQLSDEDPKIAFDLYNPISTPWSLTGTPQSVFDTNKKVIALIERNQKWYGFTKFFQDRFSEYYLEK